KGDDPYRKLNFEKQKKATEDLKRQDPPLTDLEKKKLEKDLADASDRLKYATVPTPVAKQIINEKGEEVQLPAAPPRNEAQQHSVNGRRLFTEKGCLACHAHQGTTVAQ